MISTHEMTQAVDTHTRVVFECAECSAPISWPVTVDAIRRPVETLDEPAPGVAKIGTSKQFGGVAVIPLESARVDTASSIKQARNCPNGHFVARVRTTPHPAPHYAELPLERVIARRISS